MTAIVAALLFVGIAVALLGVGAMVLLAIRKESDSRIATIAAIVGPTTAFLALVATLYTTQRQLEGTTEELLLTRKGQEADRFVASTRQLSDSEEPTILAGIYGLETVARGDSTYEQPVFSVLAATLVRSTDQRDSLHRGRLTATARQAIANVLRRWPRARGLAKYRLDFRHADLRGMNFGGIDFRRAILDSVDFRGADLTSANFDSASLRGARLDSAWLMSASLCDSKFGAGTSFVGVKLARTYLQEDSFQQALRVARGAASAGDLPDNSQVDLLRISGTYRDTVTLVVLTRGKVPYSAVDSVSGRVWRQLRAAAAHSTNEFRKEPVRTCEDRPPPSGYHLEYSPT